MSTVISVENICKSYRLGAINGGTLRADVARWLAKLRGKTDPNLQIGQEHHARLAGQEFKALQDVSFKVKQGEILGIIGRNGAGKSTLLKILSRVTAPTSGEVKVKGRIASLLEVGTGFHPELTGRENIFLNGAILGMSKAEIRKKFDEIVDFSGVEQFIDTPVKRYSSGMYVRLAFAVAAHLEPEILIVDEVLAVGDVEFQNKCMGKMKDVSSSGRTILFVSHNLTAVAALCDIVLWMQAGEILEHGNTRHLIERYTANSSRNDANKLVPLSQKPRTGSGAGKFTQMVVRPLRAGAIDANHLVAGKSVEINLEITSYIGFKDANVAIVLYDSNDYRLVDVNTASKGDFLTLAPHQKGSVTFTLHDLLLKPAKYSIELWLGRGGVEDIDFIREAGILEIYENIEDVRHTETFPGPYQCRFTYKIYK